MKTRTIQALDGNPAPLDTTIVCPPDKSLTHRAVMFASMATGLSRIDNPLLGADCRSTMAVFRALGVQIELHEEANRPAYLLVDSPGWHAWKSPSERLDFGNSGTTARLLTGVFAATDGLVVEASGDASLNARPMGRVVNPLRSSGARIEGKSDDGQGGITLPLKISGTELKPAHYKIDKASAQIKSCLLLAGMRVHGETVVELPIGSRDHTEKILAAIGAIIQVNQTSTTETITLKGPVTVPARDVLVPGDPSSAAFWAVYGAIRLGSKLTITNVLSNFTRCGFIGVLQDFGVEVHHQISSDHHSGRDAIEPAGDITIHAAHPLKGIVIKGEQIPTLVDEIPILAVAAAFARGPSRFEDLAELRVKESDRLAETKNLLLAMGCGCDIEGDDLVIEGGLKKSKAFSYHSRHDHRLAMAAAIAAQFAEGPCTIEAADCADVSYPGFYEELARLL
jgi:3-phosphoshikimate 1-carboxyvinyltransferase